MNSSLQQVTEPQAPREDLQATTSVLPQCVQSYWPRPCIHLLLISYFLSQGFSNTERITKLK